MYLSKIVSLVKGKEFKSGKSAGLRQYLFEKLFEKLSAAPNLSPFKEPPPTSPALAGSIDGTADNGFLFTPLKPFFRLQPLLLLFYTKDRLTEYFDRSFSVSR